MSDIHADCRNRIVDAVPARLVCYDTDRKILWINDYSAQLLGRQPEALLGKTCCEVWQNCSQPFMDCHIIKALRTAEPQKAEIETAQGRIWSLKVCPQKDESGRISFLCEYGHDITERVRLKELEDDINAITRHDLKSPAIATLNTVRLIKNDENLTTDQRDLLQELEKNGRHMLEIINHTLTLQKIERGEYESTIKRINILEILKDVSSSLLDQVEKKNLRFLILVNGEETREGEAFFVNAEENLLRTALMNLIKNAVEASPPDETVTLEAEDGPPRKLSIHNHGAVPAEIREKFFGKYVTHGKRGGTGLGTYSAKKMIEAQNASVNMSTSGDNGGRTTIVIGF